MSAPAYVDRRGDVLIPTCQQHATVWRGAPTWHPELAAQNVTVHNTDMHPDAGDQLDIEVA